MIGVQSGCELPNYAASQALSTVIVSEPHASAGMAGVGALRRLFRTFLCLKGSCQRSDVTFYSDCDGDCHVTLKVTTPRHGFQSPCIGGAHSRSQEKRNSGAPRTLLPQPKEFLTPRKLLQHLPLPLPEGAGDGDLPRYFTTNKDD